MFTEIEKTVAAPDVQISAIEVAQEKIETAQKAQKIEFLRGLLKGKKK